MHAGLRPLDLSLTSSLSTRTAFSAALLNPDKIVIYGKQVYGGIISDNLWICDPLPKLCMLSYGLQS
jgi:hypothetical protein